MMLTFPYLLEAFPLFSHLKKEETDLLLTEGYTRTYKRGQLLFAIGDNVTHFYITCRGIVQLFRVTPDGHELTSDILIAGESINVDELLTPSTIHHTSARMVEETCVLAIPIGWMKAKLQASEKLAVLLCRTLAERLHNAHLEAEHHATMSSAQIVACYLQKLCVLYRADPKGFTLPYRKTLIASRLHMELETFSRALHRLREHGIIVTGNQVCFTHLPEIKHYACDACSLSEECEARWKLHGK